jgi:hypothetical protein
MNLPLMIEIPFMLSMEPECHSEKDMKRELKWALLCSFQPFQWNFLYHRAMGHPMLAGGVIVSVPHRLAEAVPHGLARVIYIWQPLPYISPAYFGNSNILPVTGPHVLNVVTLLVTSQKGIVRSPHQYTIVVRVTTHWGKCWVDPLDNWGCKISRLGYAFLLSPPLFAHIECQHSRLEVKNLPRTGVQLYN